MRIFLFLIVLSTSSMAQNLQITAHRGASGYAPENTIAAVRRALEIGVGRIEIDVQQTSDRVVVLLHDKTLDRTTNAKGKVGEITYGELKDVRAHGAFEADFQNEPIPTLEQVFEIMDGSTEFVIEIKAGNKTYPGIEDNVVALIKKYKAEKWAVVHSFNDQVLKHINTHHPDIRLQKLFVSYSGGIMLDFRLHAAKLDKYDYVEGFGISLTGTSKKLVEKIHALGKKVHVWTVNKNDDMQAMINLGVDGLISNYPDKVKELIGRK